VTTLRADRGILRLMARDLTVIVAAFLAATGLAGAFGAANFGSALAFGQMGFLAALVWVLLRD
jgi:hypothetical protein